MEDERRLKVIRTRINFGLRIFACTKLLSGALAALLMGCMVHRTAENPEPLVPAGAEYEEVSAAPKAEAVPVEWWRGFEDERLDELIAMALEGNLELRQFAARIEQAEALVRQSGARLFPMLDAVGDYEARWVRPEGGRTTREQAASVGGLLDWELDVWGRLRSARRAQIYEAVAVKYDLLAARVFLSAAVAETYFEIVEQRRQLRLLGEQIEANETLLDLTRLRFGQGQSSIVDVLQQQEQLAATLSLLPLIEARVEQLEYALDVLLGVAPGGRARLASTEWPALPPLPLYGVPSDLLDQRPDLLASESLVRALDYRVGQAIAARLPQFAIGGSLSAVGDPGYSALVSAAFASVAGPVFDAGLRKAEVELQKARLREAVAEWSENYLTAVRDVETALMQERKQAEQVERIEEQLEIARRLLRETRNRYAQGLTDYLPVLNAVVTEQNLERELVQNQRALLSFRVALHRALGGQMNWGMEKAQAAL